MSKKLLREIRKLEVRLEDFLRDEDKFVKGLRLCLEKCRELHNELEKSKPDFGQIKELMKLKLEATTAFNEALKSGSVAEHEKSHLLESYGALILAIEESIYPVLTAS